MKLVTFQSLEALKDLVNKGYLECKEEYIDLKKSGTAYSWISEKMSGIIKNDTGAKISLTDAEQMMNTWKYVRKYERAFDKCITTDSDVLQGCVWRINLDEVEQIEFLSDDAYVYGSLNYIRNNGKRINWREDFYKRLKEEAE